MTVTSGNESAFVPSGDSCASLTPCDIAIALDRSGSMADCAEAARAAVNGYLKKIQSEGLAGSLSVILFDSVSVEAVRDRVAIEACAPVAAHEYIPRAVTPLLDAVGLAIARLDADAAEGRRAILVVLTDGLENASREHTAWSIRSAIEARRKSGWLFVYLGADHDAWHEAEALGFSPRTTANFRRDTLDAVEAGLWRVSYAHFRPDAGPDAQFSDHDRKAMGHRYAPGTMGS